MLRWIALLPLAFIAPAALASSDATICDRAAAAAAHGSDVPLTYLQALTRTETGRASGGKLTPWPWTVNMEGEGRWFETRAEALAYVKAHHKRGARSFDIGCFQINYRWHGEAFGSIAEMFDPLANARYAAAFLTELRGGEGKWRRAVGRYHSKTPKFAAKYKKRFDRILAALAPPASDERAPAARTAPAPAPVRTVSAEGRGMAHLAFLGSSSGALITTHQMTEGASGPAGGVAVLIGAPSGGLFSPAKPLLH